MAGMRTFSPLISKWSFRSGVTGIPLWLLSYSWVLSRIAGCETEAVWVFVVVCEIASMMAGLFAIVAGLLARRYLSPDSLGFKRAGRGVLLGTGVWICIVIFNLAGIFLFS
jgi:hypothetical protein